ncbi:helix-turn-helix domain-containing protein [Chromobacterium sphagni]|uniref:helix-turn-helix domain-containing protein n=1 Tax=Chromobacterium sphagni TaxID=1903179 RepID=UPI0009F67057|nr:helix-turn-helix domain-containing protein [Chromobacterium sphagni]
MENKNARPAEAETSANHTADTSNLATAAQRQRMLEALRSGPVSTFDARARLNILAPAPRVKELRESGFVILTKRESLPDERGIVHPGIARYVLISEPPAKAVA